MKFAAQSFEDIPSEARFICVLQAEVTGQINSKVIYHHLFFTTILV